MKARIHAILARPGVEVVIACDEEDDDSDMGFACFEGDCLHFLGVRYDMAGLGGGQDFTPEIAAALLEGRAVRAYTHKTMGMPVREGWAFEPFRGTT